jgi:DnaK suppressor protein
VSGFTSSSAPAARPVEDEPPATDTLTHDSSSWVTAALDEEIREPGFDVSAGTGVDDLADADTPGGGDLEGEEQGHRAAVDAVDQLLDEVELAMARLDDGTYGRCETCGVLIDDAVLAVGPLERECVPCSAGILALDGV